MRGEPEAIICESSQTLQLLKPWSSDSRSDSVFSQVLWHCLHLFYLSCFLFFICGGNLPRSANAESSAFPSAGHYKHAESSAPLPAGHCNQVRARGNPVPPARNQSNSEAWYWYTILFMFCQKRATATATGSDAGGTWTTGQTFF